MGQPPRGPGRLARRWRERVRLFGLGGVPAEDAAGAPTGGERGFDRYQEGKRERQDARRGEEQCATEEERDAAADQEADHRGGLEAIGGAIGDRARVPIRPEAEESAAQEPEPMPIIVEELLTYVADLQRYQRGLPLAEVEVRLPGGLAPVRGVEAQLRHALLSLVINAKEALADHPAPSITLAAEPGDGGMRLLVEDNGPGMTDEQRHRALEPFHTTRDGHLGIGLPVAARLAEKNGGRLALERRAEGGTRAILRLPCWKRP